MKRTDYWSERRGIRCSALLWAILAIGMLMAGFSGAAQIRVNIEGQQTIIDTTVAATEAGDQSGRVEFVINDDQVRVISQPGQPAIPSQIIQLLLPPSAKLDTVASLLEAAYVPFEGAWYVSPVPPMGTWDQEGQEIIVWPTDRTIVDGVDIGIYGTNDFWPAGQAQLINTGRLRSWKLAELAVPLFRYNPVTGQLLELAEAELTVDSGKENAAAFKKSGIKSIKKEHKKNKERVRDLAVNFEQAAAAYEEEAAASSLQEIAAAGDVAAASPTLTDTGYVIITTNAIRNASTKLAAFVAHKQATYTVSVITQDQYGVGTGDTAANNIRAWLAANYNNSAYGNGGILYVLLIGDPRTDSASVPMKMCIGDHPTDYYYAELTSNWDANGNGIYGEEADSTEKYFEVYVGRIPYYGTISETDSILQKTITYETSANTAWRRNVLLPMVPLDDATQAYQIGEQIKYNLLEPLAIPSTRIYDKTYGLLPPPEYLRENRYPATEWSQGIYGMLIWETHGNVDFAGGVIGSGDTPALNNNYPTAVFQGSCLTGHPETTNNLGYSILKNGGIGTVAASRNGWYWIGETSYTNSSSQGGMGYQYAKRLVSRKTMGQALWDTKEALSYWQKNYFVHNLYGDPSVVVMPSVPNFIVTPTHGAYFNITYGGTTGDQSTYTLKNSSTASMSWTVESDVDWMTVTPSQGTLSAGGSATVTIRLNNIVTAMATGTHYGTITLNNTTLSTVEKRTVVLTVNPKSLRGYWRLDETAGTTASDATGNGKDGTLKGENTFNTNTAGKFGNALRFDGVDDYVEIPALDLYSNTVTMSAWLNRNSTQVDSAGIVFSRAAATVAGISIRSSGELLYHWNDAGTAHGWSTGLIVPSGQGVFVALVVEPTRATMYMYDGTIHSTSQTVTHAIEEFNGALCIGRDPTGSRYLKGSIDDVRIYSEALSADQINALILGGVAESPRPFNGADDVLLVTDLKWVMGAAMAGNDVYFGTTYNDVLNADLASLQYKGRQTQTTFSPGTLKRSTQYFWRIDQVDAVGTVTRGSVWSFATGNGRGGITRQVWSNITGESVANLTSAAKYPNSPDITGNIESFNCPKNWADYYGTRVHGFLIPPTTGSYTFWIAGDDYCELWLSSGINPASSTKIAYFNGATGWQEWTRFTTQKSASVTLTAGKPYYIKALQKEGAGDDHLSVAWSGPGITRDIIPGNCLMPYASDYKWGPSFTAAPMTGQDAFEGYVYQGSIAGSAVAFNGGAVSYSKAAGPLWLTVASNGSVSGIPGDGDTGDYTFEVRATDAQGAFSDALYNITVWNTFTGEMGLSDFAGLAAHWLSSGCTDNPLCGGADLTGDGAVNGTDLMSFADLWLIENVYGGLRSHWSFDTDASDTVSGNHGTLAGGAVITSTDAIYALGNGALSLDGVNDYVEISGYKGVMGTAGRTCAAWIKTSGSSANSVIMDWGTAGAEKKWLFGVFSTGELTVYTWPSYIKTNRTVTDNQWHHVAAVLTDDGTPNVSEIKLYVDGQLQAVTANSTQALNTVSAGNVLIGAYDAAGTKGGYFNGLIDDAQIYDRAMSAPEIEALALVSLQVHLPFDETAGTAAQDVSFNGRPGQLINGPVWQPGLDALGGALSFDGVDDYVEIPGYKGMQGTASRTCSAWIKTSGSSANAVIMDWGTSDAEQKWVFGLFSTGELTVYTWPSYIKTSKTVTDNQWHHVAAVLTDDGTPNVSEIKLYVDGQLQVATANSTQALNTVPAGNVLIGAYDAAGTKGGYFHGAIDDVRIYDRALKASEIEYLAH